MATNNSPQWIRAMDECQMQLISDARVGHLPGYTEAAKRITSFEFLDGHDSRFRDLLYDISDREAEAGRPLLSALVVHKSGRDQGRPGDGFFSQLCVRHGRDISDRERCWKTEVEAALDYWRSH
jgi:hypothetical protein